MRFIYLTVLILIQLSCFTAGVIDAFWEPPVYTPGGFEEPALTAENLYITADGRLYLEAQVARREPGEIHSGEYIPRSEVRRLYCLDKTLDEIVKSKGAAGPGKEGENKYTYIRLGLNTKDECKIRQVKPPVKHGRQLRNARNRLFLPDLGLEVELPYGLPGPHRYLGEGLKTKLKKMTGGKPLPYLGGNEFLYLVDEVNDEYLQLKQRRVGEWYLSLQGAGYSRLASEKEKMISLTTRTFAPGPVILVNLEDLDPVIDDGKTVRVFRQYAGSLKNLPPAFKSMPEKEYTGALFLELVLSSHRALEKEFHPGNLALNIVAVPLLPVAVVADVITSPIQLIVFITVVNALERSCNNVVNQTFNSCL